MIRAVWLIARKEVLASLHSVRFIFTMDLICLLFLASAFMMLSDYRMRRQAYEAKAKAHAADVAALMAETDPHQQFRTLFWEEGLAFDRPPIPMSVLVKGLDLQMPLTVQTSAWEEKQSSDDVYRNPILKLYLSPDFAYIVNIILSLLAFLFVFDAICGEKEDGTLKLMLSYPVPKVAVILGKWLGGFATLMGPVLVSTLFWMIIVTASNTVSFDTETVTRFFTIVGVSVMYVGVFFCLGMFISALTASSNTALLVCFFVWVIWIVVIPNAAPVAAKVLAPIPSRQVIEELKKDADAELGRRIAEAQRSMLSYSDELQKLTDELKAEAEAEKQHIEAFYDTRVRRQSRITGLLARLSPAGSYMFAVTTVAGTGLETYNGVAAAIGKYQSDYRATFNRLRGNRLAMPAGWLTPDSLPRVNFPRMQLDDTLDAAMFDVLLLLLYNVVFFMLAFTAFLVYDPK
ncbi:MAG: ABC transporter permease subunit [Planctomycetota bacterium]